MRDYFNPIKVDRDPSEDWSEGKRNVPVEGQEVGPMTKALYALQGYTFGNELLAELYCKSHRSQRNANRS